MVVVVGMEEEVEERLVEELVAEMKGRVAGQGGSSRWLWGCHSLAAMLAGKRRKGKRMNEREGKKGGGYIRENDYYHIAILLT